MVKELTETEAHISTGEVLPYGMAVWSTGVGPTSFTTSLPFAKTARGRIAIDGEMRVLQHIDPEKTGQNDPNKPSDVGDRECCASNVNEHTKAQPLALAGCACSRSMIALTAVK